MMRRPSRHVLPTLLMFCFALGQTQAQFKALDSKPQVIAPPYQLTSSDGVGLKLTKLEAKAVIDGPLAFTELYLTFKNPQARTIEGRFEITMPDRAAISRFAMKIRGHWMEGEVVEKQAARRAYEDALHRGQDPALLEQDAGNHFRARVFPISAHEEKELVISWSQELESATERYTLPLVGLPKIDQLSLTALIAKQGSSGIQSSLGGDTGRYEVTKVLKSAFKPNSDWILTGGDQKEQDALAIDELALVQYSIPQGQSDKNTSELPKSLLVLFDSSASRMIDYQGRVSKLGQMIKKLSDDKMIDHITVLAFDQSTEQIFSGPVEKWSAENEKKLIQRGALGASNLVAGLEALSKIFNDQTERKTHRLLLISDGVYTTGEQDLTLLKGLCKEKLSALGVTRVDVLVEGAAKDLATLEMLTTLEGFQAGKVLTDRMSQKEMIKRLSLPTHEVLKVRIDGAKWTWPSEVKGKQAGDQVLIFAEMKESGVEQLTGTLSSSLQKFELSLKARAAQRPLLERAWVRARIERLSSQMESQDPDLKGVLKEQIIKLSTHHRVLSPYTALVVLETENDYQRFSIDRNALSHILTVGEGGVTLKSRTAKSLAVPPPPPQPKPTPKVKSKTVVKKSKGRKMKKRALLRRQVISNTLLDNEDHFEGSRSVEAEPELKRAARPIPSSAPRRDVEDSLDVDETSRIDSPRANTAQISPPPPPTASPQRESSSSGAVRPQEAPQASIHRDLEESTRDEIEIQRSPQTTIAPLTGEMEKIQSLIQSKKSRLALKRAKKWRKREPTSVLSLIALGRSFELSGDLEGAARAYGSIIDFFPSRADMRRLAGNLLETIKSDVLAQSSYHLAAEQRPDHPGVYHMKAMSLTKLGRYEDAIKVLLEGVRAKRAARFEAIEQILGEDVQLIAAAWAAKEPKMRNQIESLLAKYQLKIDDRETKRFILSWETDANDVDFHIYDRFNDHAFYSNRTLVSGGRLYADITTGYGPECFTIYEPKAGPYSVSAHYYRRGPMGYGAGRLQAIHHDGKGNLNFDERVFVIMQDRATVEFGSL